MRITYFILFLFFYSFLGVAQENAVDSICYELKRENLSAKTRFDLTIILCHKAIISDSPHWWPIVENKADYLTYIFEAKQWADKNGNKNQQTEIREYELFYYSLKEQASNTIRIGHELIVTDKFTSIENKVNVYTLMSEAYNKMEYYSEYIRLTPQKYAVLKEANYTEHRFNESGDIGLACYKMKQYDKARGYFKRALELNSDSVSLLHQSSYLNNIGLCFAKEHRIDSAIFYYNKALLRLKKSTENGEENKNYEGTYRAHFQNILNSNIVLLNYKEQDYNTIINILEIEVTSGKKHLEPHIFLEAYNNLAKVCYHHNKYNLALRYLEKAKKEIVPSQKNAVFFDNIELTAKTYLALNMQKKADSLFDYLDFTKDSLEIIKSSNHSKIATILYETEKKESEIKKQLQQLKNKENEIYDQQQKQLFFTGIIFFLIILLALGYFLFKKTKRQKQLIDNTLKQKELLLKEIHHRVKNNLQVVSSILKSQANRSDDPVFKELMTSSQNRIKTMAIIHQNLSQIEDFGNIDFKEYVIELVKNITLSCKNTETTIDTTINITGKFLHIDIAVPLGLILNELITNCYKYAFINRVTGTIEISLEKFDDQRCVLSVTDNGIGLPEDLDEKSQNSLGLTMIRGLAWQLDGEMNYSSNKNGSVFIVSFIGSPSNTTNS